MRKVKISIIGAGAVGSQVAFNILADNLASEIVLVDINGSLAKGIALDLEDGRFFLNSTASIKGTDKIKDIASSQIVVFTAGQTRRPGMDREDLISTNAKIAKEVALKIKRLCPAAFVVTVTNPLDIINAVFCKYTRFQRERVIGMGSGLDAGRLANLIFKHLKIQPQDISAWVFGQHGRDMLVSSATNINGMGIEEFLSAPAWEKIKSAVSQRGAEVVKFLRQGSARFGPALAVRQILKALVEGKKTFTFASVWLLGEYGIKGVSLGVPVFIGQKGIEEIIEVDLEKEEKASLKQAAAYLSKCIKSL